MTKEDLPLSSQKTGSGHGESDFNLLRWLLYRPSHEEMLAIGALSGLALGTLTVEGPMNTYAVLQYFITTYISIAGSALVRSATIHKDFNFEHARDFPGFSRLYFAHHFGRSVTLEDGARIRPGDWIGYVSANDNIGPKNEIDLLKKHSPSLVAEVMLVGWLQGMVKLADEIEIGRLEPRIKAITAETHFAGTATARHLGFEIHNAGLLKYLESHAIARDVARNIEDTSPESVRRIWNRVKIPWMSVDKLLTNKPIFEKEMRMHENRVTRLLSKTDYIGFGVRP